MAKTKEFLKETLVTETAVVKSETPVTVAEPIKEVVVAAPVFLAAEKSTFEDKILSFIKEKTTDEVKLNDFIKSLYGIPKVNEKPKYQDKQESRFIRSVLLKLQSGGLKFSNSEFMKLGSTYYQGEEQFAKQVSIDNINILVKK